MLLVARECIENEFRDSWCIFRALASVFFRHYAVTPSIPLCTAFSLAKLVFVMLS